VSEGLLSGFKLQRNASILNPLFAEASDRGSLSGAKAVRQRLAAKRKISVSLSREPKNLELLLRDVDAKGFLDIELVWQLRQEEGLRNVRGKIVRKIQQNESAYSFEGSVLNVLEEAP
jgi:hypothetical protein